MNNSSGGSSSSSPSLIALRYFERAAATGSFTAAAIHFHASVSTVSRQIQGLETLLGQRLFDRHTRAVRLTEAGSRYQWEVREILARLDTVHEELRALPNIPLGRLRINAPQAFGRRHLTVPALEFQRHYPAVELELTYTDAYLDPVREGFDLSVRIGTPRDSALIGRTLASERMVVCAAPAYLDRAGIPATPEALREHRCLLYQGAHGLQRWYFKSPGAMVVEYAPPTRFVSNDAECLLDAALAGEGLVLFPLWLIADALATGRLERVLGDWQAALGAERREIMLLYPGQRTRSAKLNLFIEHLCRHLGSPPYWERHTVETGR